MPEARNPRRVVYTAVVGGYEALNDQPAAASSGADFICFTDDPELVSESWQVRLIEPRFELDPVRSARWLKTRGPELLGDYDESLWIDNTVRLSRPPEQLLDDWLADHDIAMPKHSMRASVIAEFEAVATHGYDDASRVYEQLIQYSAIDDDVLREVPYWTGIIARRHTEAVLGASGLWSDHILRFSRRDQLSVNFAMSRSSVAVRGVELDNDRSEWHEWPIHSERRWERTRQSVSHAMRPPVVEIGVLQNTIRELNEQIERERAEREAEKQRAAEANRRLRDGYRGSLSWRVTAPLRFLLRPWRSNS